MMQPGRPRPIKSTVRGFTLLELAVALGIFLLLAAVLVPSILTYRARSSVNESASLTQSVIQQGAEIAKTAGSPLLEVLRQDGLATGSSQATPGVQVVVRLRKRLVAGEPAQTLLERVVAKSGSVLTEFHGLGVLDIDSDTSHLGVFVEILERQDSGSDVVLVSLPIDVNGEFVLEGAMGEGRIRYRHNTYSRELRLTVRGTATLDRR